MPRPLPPHLYQFLCCCFFVVMVSEGCKPGVGTTPLGHSGPICRFGWWPRPMCFCLGRFSRSIFRPSARRRHRRLRACVAHLPVFRCSRCSRCSRCRWFPVRAENEALLLRDPVFMLLLLLGRCLRILRHIFYYTPGRDGTRNAARRPGSGGASPGVWVRRTRGDAYWTELLR